MRRIRELARLHGMVSLGVAILAVVGVVAGAQWWVNGGDVTIRTEVLGASASIPPAPSITSGPAANSTVSSTPLSFAYSDSQAGVGFQCKLDSATFAACAKSGVTYAGLGAGAHTFSVEAQQGSGPPSQPATRTWTVLLAPPTPTITSGPANPTIQPDASFSFGDTHSGVTFQCALDSAASAACTSPANYDGLAAGSHTFSVQAVNGPAVSPAAISTWTITSPTFGISGDLTAPLAPGVTVPLNLVFTNPYSSAKGINITGVTVTVQHATTKGGQTNLACDGQGNVNVTNGTAWPLNVPRSSTKSLSDLSVPQAQWPQVTMIDLPTNQDSCKGTTFKFSYTGTATK